MKSKAWNVFFTKLWANILIGKSTINVKISTTLPTIKKEELENYILEGNVLSKALLMISRFPAFLKFTGSPYCGD
jgi:hypothetical protein